MTKLKVVGNKVLRLPSFSVNYRNMSEGELNTILLARQMELIGGYSNDGDMLNKSKSISAYIGSKKDLLEIPKFNDSFIDSFIEKQKPKFWHCCAGKSVGAYIGNPTSFNEWEESEREVCNEILRVWNNTSWIRFSERKRLKKLYEECTDKLSYISNLNRNLEKSAYQPLYTFVKGSADPVRVITKSVLHNNFVSSLSEVTGLSFETISLWVRNGVLASGISEGLGDMQPEESIEFMRLNKGNPIGSGVGEPVTIIATVALILKIVAAALPALVAMINAFKDQDKARILSASESVGNPSWGPENSDWIGAGRVDLKTLLLVIGGAYLINENL